MVHAAPLYLASQSLSRQYLLRESHITYAVVQQTAQEDIYAWDTFPLEVLVVKLAELKNAHAQLPQAPEQSISFTLTADTLSQDHTGTIHGKPHDHDDARTKIRMLRDGSYVSTGFCITRQHYKNGVWHEEARITAAVTAFCVFDVPDNWLDLYLARTSATEVSGAITIDHFGMQFLKRIDGSYSTIVGLPLFEVREALESMGFFSRPTLCLRSA